MPKSRQRDSFASPRFAQPATFMRLPHQTELDGVDVAILGVPFDSGSSYRSGARLGPREIRAQSSLIRPYSYFQKVSPFHDLVVVDAGDVDAPEVGIEKAFAAIEDAVRRVLACGAIPMIAGGDHSISLPILRAIAGTHGPLEARKPGERLTITFKQRSGATGTVTITAKEDPAGARSGDR